MSELVEIRHLHPSAHTKARTWVRASEREQYKTAFSKRSIVPNLGQSQEPFDRMKRAKDTVVQLAS